MTQAPETPQTKSISTKSKPRGRPGISAEKRTHMRARISSIAETLFKAEGYGNVSLRRIAKDIGCTPMTLYGYYDSKIDILRSLWGSVFAELFKTLQDLPLGSCPQENLGELGTVYVEYWLSQPEHYRLVFMAEGVSQPDVSIFLDGPDIISKFEIFVSAISKAAPAETAEDELKSKFDFFLSTLHGVAHNYVTISGYGWSSPRAQIAYAVHAVSKRLGSLKQTPASVCTGVRAAGSAPRPSLWCLCARSPRPRCHSQYHLE